MQMQTSDECEITAHSEKQAMEWSLVLTSQEIPTTILRSEETNRWALQVGAGDYDRAREAIRQFRLENRGSSWRERLDWPDLLFHWGAAWVCVILAAIYALAAFRLPQMNGQGQMDSLRVFGGEW